MTPQLTTKNGHDFFAVSSMLQKAIRRGEVADAAWAVAELAPKYAAYVWRRLLVVSAEDCSSFVTGEVVALYDAWQVLHRHDSSQGHRIFLLKAILLMACAKHTRDSDELGLLVADRMTDERIERGFLEAAVYLLDNPADDDDDRSIPDYVYDVHTRVGRRRGKTVEQFITEEHEMLSDPSSIWRNWKEISESPVYVEPEVDFDS